jgi:cytochrome c peroxidase
MRLRHLALQVVALVLVRATVASASASASASADPDPYTWPLIAWMPPPPVPADNPRTAEKVDLGRHLFYDARLSRDETVACANFHVHGRAFTDGRATTIGIDGTQGAKNAPGFANVGYLPVLTWANPHMDSLEFQALVPLFGKNLDEIGGIRHGDAIFVRLAADPTYQTAFVAAFHDRPALDLFTVTRALGAFQRSIISVDAPYDRYKYWASGCDD